LPLERLVIWSRVITPYIYGVKYLLPLFFASLFFGENPFSIPYLLYASFPRKFQDKNGRFFHYFPYRAVLLPSGFLVSTSP
jgi:hypothetical protein